MEITREVVNDLMPVYLAGEASADTARLVDEFLAKDSEFARAVRGDGARELLGKPVTLLPNEAKRALELTKRLIKRQTWFFAFALLFSLVPLSIRIESGTVRMIMMDTPVLAMGYWIVALGCWGGYYRTRRRLNVSGLN